MARHKLLAIVSLLSGLTNLILSITFVRLFGLVGVAVGTLIPTALVCLFFVLPYSMRLLGIHKMEVVKEVLFPALAPALPMAAALYFLRGIPGIDSLFFLLAVMAAGVFIYGLGYLSLKANARERQALQNLIVNTLRTAKVYLRFS
jgi:O-antigen/teichoic acid export membrane protein